MSEDPATQRVLLTLPDMAHVTVERDLVYGERNGAPLHLDLYRPPRPTTEPSAIVIFVAGYPGEGFKRFTGTSFREMGAYVSWGELTAASGMTAVTYDNVDPVEDVRTLLAFLVDHADRLGIDPARIAIWSCSGNVPVALSLMARPAPHIRCAALCYGYPMDLDGATGVQQMSAQFGFVNATAELPFEALARLPTLIVRAGKDEVPGLNASLDPFIARCLDQNFPLTVINYADGVHAFDLSDDSPRSKQVIRQILNFLATELGDMQ
jgi:dienelactone hydrolase